MHRNIKQSNSHQEKKLLLLVTRKQLQSQNDVLLVSPTIHYLVCRLWFSQTSLTFYPTSRY